MRPGDRVGGFVLEAEVASGGMGTVWRAVDDAGTPVAIKLLLDRDPNTLARFAREAALLGDLSHPHIVRYVAHGTDAAGPWLAMEWLDAEPLGARLERGMSIADAVAIGAQVADALGAAHRIGVIHRDIKPSNVLVMHGSPPSARVIDFGIARLAGNRGTSVTRTGYLVGTPGYAAPEQIRRSRDVDTRCDVFSLGCILYLGVTGRHAFSGSELRATLTRTLYADPIPIANLVNGVPPALIDLIHAMLRKDPEARPADGTAVAAALGQLGVLPTTVSAVHGSRRPASTVTLDVPQVAAIVIGWDDDDPSTSEITRDLDAPDQVTRVRQIAAIGAAHQVVFDELVDGGFSAVLDIDNRATLARAARCALAIAEAEPRARIAIVTGAREGGEVAFDRACQEVTAATLAGLSASVGSRGIVRVDRAVASSVEGRAVGLDDDMFEI
jgi:serine/threonine protein kinase